MRPPIAGSGGGESEDLYDTPPNRTDVTQLFPDLAGDGDFHVTSADDPQYNCIAWAASVDDRWWWPLPPGTPTTVAVNWPVQPPPAPTLEAFVTAFETLGFVRSEDGELDPAVEKIALYLDQSGKPTHAARQLADGTWTSKLGPYFDISHGTPEAVQGDEYGTLGAFLERPRAAGA